ncbi:hypothetical protein E4099_03540 [Streptomyces palmae]|uniref:Uncharacterized protein n=1 Tax=Streptomyces palmae TaxID=1701085 RepID=A0A4Z0HI83_9ACTN|nr:hypothetical protein E4099_03540 [Streptomyces palmae]
MAMADGLHLVFVPRAFQPAADAFDERSHFIGPSMGGREQVEQYLRQHSGVTPRSRAAVRDQAPAGRAGDRNSAGCREQRLLGDRRRGGPARHRGLIDAVSHHVRASSVPPGATPWGSRRRTATMCDR